MLIRLYHSVARVGSRKGQEVGEHKWHGMGCVPLWRVMFTQPEFPFHPEQIPLGKVPFLTALLFLCFVSYLPLVSRNGVGCRVEEADVGASSDTGWS